MLTSFESAPKPLMSIVTYHFAAKDLSQTNNALERYFFTREYGFASAQAVLQLPCDVSILSERLFVSTDALGGLGAALTMCAGARWESFRPSLRSKQPAEHATRTVRC